MRPHSCGKPACTSPHWPAAPGKNVSTLYFVSIFAQHRSRFQTHFDIAFLPKPDSPSQLCQCCAFPRHLLLSKPLPLPPTHSPVPDFLSISRVMLSPWTFKITLIHVRNSSVAPGGAAFGRAGPRQRGGPPRSATNGCSRVHTQAGRRTQLSVLCIKNMVLQKPLVSTSLIQESYAW